MTEQVEIKMRGELDTFRLNTDFQALVYELNLAGQQGKQYVLLRNTDDRMVAINTRNILTAVEVDDDDGLIG